MHRTIGGTSGRVVSRGEGSGHGRGRSYAPHFGYQSRYSPPSPSALLAGIHSIRSGASPFSGHNASTVPVAAAWRPASTQASLRSTTADYAPRGFLRPPRPAAWADALGASAAFDDHEHHLAGIVPKLSDGEICHRMRMPGPVILNLVGQAPAIGAPMFVHRP